MDETVRKETGYILTWVLLLSMIMEAIALICGGWSLSFLLGNVIGAVAATGNFFLLAVTVTRLVNSGDTEQFKQKMHASKSMRQLGMVLVCVLGIALLKTNVYATLIPLVFPRIGLAVKQFRNPQGQEPAEDEGSELT